MLSVDHGFSTSVKRSGHAACWCAALGGIVQFGGWPPNEQLSDVVRHEGSSCPLFYMPATTIARHLHRADQRRRVDNLEVALAHHRQYRLRELLDMTSNNTHPTNNDNTSEQNMNGECTPRVDRGLSVTALLQSSTHSTPSVTTEEASESGFVYDEGYVSDHGESEEAGSSDGSDDGSASSEPRLHSNSRSAARIEAAATMIDSAQAATSVSSRYSNDAFIIASSRTALSPLVSPRLSTDPVSPTGIVGPNITVDLLRQVVEDTADRRAFSAFNNNNNVSYNPSMGGESHGGRTGVSGSTHTGRTASTLHRFSKGNHHHPAMEREAPPLQRDTQEVLGKYTVRPLRWQSLRPVVAPRTRHGHHLVSCGDRLYVVGGSYWAHGNALASTDMMYDIRKKVWQQVSSLFPPRFCAALARSNTVPEEEWMSAALTTATMATETSSVKLQLQDDQVLYYFGGLNYSRQLTNTLYRLWLPHETLEELPQYGAIPREQFKGILVCDMQRECNPAERKRGEQSLGRLFYLDGLQEGRPMAPYLRVYNVATGVWVRVCPSPDLVRSQVSLLQYESVPETDAETTAVATAEVSAKDKPPARRLRRFEVVGGMPSRRGKQRRSRMCYSFDVLRQRFDYSNALPVPGLTAHCTVLLPSLPGENTTSMTTPTANAGNHLLADGLTSLAAYRAAVTLLKEKYGVWSISCGGNEDWNDAEQNSLGLPVGWLYLFAPRAIPLSEVARVQMEWMRIPPAVLGAEKDELLDELF